MSHGYIRRDPVRFQSLDAILNGLADIRAIYEEK